MTVIWRIKIVSVYSNLQEFIIISLKLATISACIHIKSYICSFKQMLSK